MEEVDQDGGWTDKDMRENGRVYLAEIARHQAVFGDQFGLFEFARDQCHGAIRIELGAPEFEFCTSMISREGSGQVEELSGGIVIAGSAGRSIVGCL